MKKITMFSLLFVGLPLSVQAATIDGIVASGEYDGGVHYNVDLGYVNGTDWVDVNADGDIYMTWQAPSLLAVAYVVPFSVNDNYFGTASLATGWNTNVGRDYSKLETSDMAQFVFQDATGQDLLTFQMDYFRDPSLPDVNGADGIDTVKNSFVSSAAGTYQPGTAGFDDIIVEWGTSLMWNFTDQSAGGGGFLFDANSSPELDTPGYVGEMIYEFMVDLTSVGAEFSMMLAESHHSPSKLGQESFTPPPETPYPTPVPEPATMALFGFGLAGLTAVRRRKGRS